MSNWDPALGRHSRCTLPLSSLYTPTLDVHSHWNKKRKSIILWTGFRNHRPTVQHDLAYFTGGDRYHFGKSLKSATEKIIFWTRFRNHRSKLRRDIAYFCVGGLYPFWKKIHELSSTNFRSKTMLWPTEDLTEILGSQSDPKYWQNRSGSVQLNTPTREWECTSRVASMVRFHGFCKTSKSDSESNSVHPRDHS